MLLADSELEQGNPKVEDEHCEKSFNWLWENSPLTTTLGYTVNHCAKTAEDQVKMAAPIGFSVNAEFGQQ